MELIKECFNCVYRENITGICHWKKEATIPLPWWLSDRGVGPHDGRDCPAWKGK